MADSAGDLLRQAVEEIRSLRRHNELLQARVETMNLLGQFVLARPPEQRGVAMGEDLTWKIERYLTPPQKGE